MRDASDIRIMKLIMTAYKSTKRLQEGHIWPKNIWLNLTDEVGVSSERRARKAYVIAFGDAGRSFLAKNVQFNINGPHPSPLGFRVNRNR